MQLMSWLPFQLIRVTCSSVNRALELTGHLRVPSPSPTPAQVSCWQRWLVS